MEQMAPFISCSYHLSAAVFTSSSLHQGFKPVILSPSVPSDPLAPLFASEILSTRREPRCLLPHWEKALATPMSKSSWPACPLPHCLLHFILVYWLEYSSRILSCFSSISGALGARQEAWVTFPSSQLFVNHWVTGRFIFHNLIPILLW